MADISQVMRIAMQVDEAVRPGAVNLARAVDGLPFKPDSPEAMTVGAHDRKVVGLAYHHVLAAVEQLASSPAYQRASFSGHVDDGVTALHTALMTGTGPIPDSSIRSAVRTFDDLVRELGSRGAS